MNEPQSDMPVERSSATISEMTPSQFSSTGTTTGDSRLLTIIFALAAVALALLFVWSRQLPSSGPLPPSYYESIPFSEEQAVQLEGQLDTSDLDALDQELDSLEAELNDELNNL